MTKYVFITGGVVSSLGKGITAASLGCLLKSRGYSVTVQKFDPYLNTSPGNMSPYQHGEVFITQDGAETDLDVGHYERFIDTDLSKFSNVSAGQIYRSILDKEQNGEYGGETIQVIPHVTNEIKSRITSADKDTDIIITEIGGTVGDIEGLPFLEAIRQMKTDLGKDNVCYIHVTLIPFLSASEEIKTKPTQHSVKDLRSLGIQPDIIVCRTEYRLPDDIKDKISLFCDIEPACIIENYNAPSIYQVPLDLRERGLDTAVLRKLLLDPAESDLKEWEKILSMIDKADKVVSISLVGKYTALKDSYISINEALFHAGIHNLTRVNVCPVDAESLESKTDLEIGQIFNNTGGIIIPDGTGKRGIEGKIKAIQYARENNIPLLGIGVGAHCIVIEATRNVADKDASFDKIILRGLFCRDPIGSFKCDLENTEKTFKIYGQRFIYERYQNYPRLYMLSNKTGLIPSRSFDVIESKEHPWLIGVQFHPEFISRPLRPHPLFLDFISAILKF